MTDLDAAVEDEYPRIETRHAGRKRFRVVFDAHDFKRRPKYFKTYNDAGEWLDRYLAKMEVETWRPTI